ncbi:hypothetical protein UlMin_000376 [Ulmus minor]
MFTTVIPRDLREACMCKCFGSSLIGPALQWFTNLPNNSISSFAQLMDTFVEQFASNKKLEKLLGDLYRIQQRRSEPLRDYVGQFNREKVRIPFCYQETAIDAFQKGLLPDGELYKDLTKFNCTSMEDFLARAWVQILWEEVSSTIPSGRLMMDEVKSDVLSDSFSRQIGVRTVTARTPTPR